MSVNLLPGIPMAKKKSAAKPNPEDWKRKPIIVALRGAPEFKAAVERLAEFDGSNVASLIDRALRRYAKDVGFPEQLPKR